VKRVRVLVANRPRLMRELVMATISDQPEIEIVGEVQDAGSLTERVEQVQPYVLILAMDELGHRRHSNQALESSEVGNLSAVRERPVIVGAARN
jgi:chemotaxis response regulator CheB